MQYSFAHDGAEFAACMYINTLVWLSKCIRPQHMQIVQIDIDKYQYTYSYLSKTCI